MFMWWLHVVLILVGFKIAVAFVLYFGLPALLFGGYGVVLIGLIIWGAYDTYHLRRASMDLVNRRNRDRLASRIRSVSSYFWDDDSF